MIPKLFLETLHVLAGKEIERNGASYTRFKSDSGHEKQISDFLSLMDQITSNRKGN